MASPLLNFLSQARSAVLRSPPSPLTLVLGNPSCDLDSFVSATVYAFFHSRPSHASHSSRLHVPILNLPSVSSGELWRLRPEFGTALRLALNGQGEDETEQSREVDKKLLDALVTIKDIRATRSSPLNHLFTRSAGSTTAAVPTHKTSVILVDHNAISIPLPDLSPPEIASNFDIVGCIDHHIDESAVPPAAAPRMIRTEVGSCTSLVVQHLRDEGLWENPIKPGGSGSNDDDAAANVELASLSLASILIDTADLTAEGRVSDTDRETVAFLEDIVRRYHHTNLASPSDSEAQSRPAKPHWDRTSLYEQLSSSKANSLSLLTLPEILDRDYKSWSEKPTSSAMTLNLGIASAVKPVTWLIHRAPHPSSAQAFINAMRDFARRGREPDYERDQKSHTALDAFALMTTSTSAVDHFRRELLLLFLLPSTGTGRGDDTLRRETAGKILARFEAAAAQEKLGLDEWGEDAELVGLLNRREDKDEEEEVKDDNDIVGRIWWQRDVAKSRKQVAPLLREAMRSL